MTEQLLLIPVGKLTPDSDQPRRFFSQKAIDELAASIASRGILQPIRVTQKESSQYLTILAGESRWRAAKQAGLAEVPCVVVDTPLSEADVLSDQLVENEVRTDLRALDFSRAMSKLKLLKGCSSQDIAAQLGISPSTVSRAEALLTLPIDVQAMVDDNRLAESVAYEISRLKDEDAMRELATLAVTKRMSRESVVAAIRKMIGQKKVRPKAGKVLGKSDGVSFTFSYASGELTAEILLKAIEQIRGKIKDLQKNGESKDIATLSDMLRSS